MTEVTELLQSLEQGHPEAAEQLLPLVYDALRKLASAKLIQEKPGQTLQATALVHEAYLRLVGPDLPQPEGGDVHSSSGQRFNSRGHFFAAASEAMRRILVEAARRKASRKHGGNFPRCDADLDRLAASGNSDPLLVLAVHEALERLAERSPRKAELVKLRYFLGCTVAEAAELLGIAAAKAEEDWTYARAWLRREWLRGQSAIEEK